MIHVFLCHGAVVSLRAGDNDGFAAGHSFQDDAGHPNGEVANLVQRSHITDESESTNSFPPGHLVHPVRLSGYPAKIVPIACDEQAKVWVRGKQRDYRLDRLTSR